MKRVFLLALLAVWSWNAAALDIAGVNVAEKVKAGEQALVLNGAGSRLMVGMFHVYVIALYLPEKQHTVAEVLADGVSKRLSLQFLFGVSSAQLLEATYKLMTENLSAEELKKSEAGWKVFAASFDHIKDINKEDQLVLDYQAAAGVRVSLNGREIGRVENPDFMRAFLLVWLGDRPAQADLKERLLGMNSADAKR